MPPPPAPSTPHRRQLSRLNLPTLLIPYDTESFGPAGIDRLNQIATHVACLVVVRDHERPQADRRALCADVIDSLSPAATINCRNNPPDCPNPPSTSVPRPSSLCSVGIKNPSDLTQLWPPGLSGWHLSASAAATLVDRCDNTSLPLPEGSPAVPPCHSRSLEQARAVLDGAEVLGASCHNRLELSRAHKLGVSYATLSPFFPSISKPGHTPSASLPELGELITAANFPIFALGGVTRNNSAACFQLGAYGVGVVGELSGASTPATVARDLTTPARQQEHTTTDQLHPPHTSMNAQENP